MFDAAKLDTFLCSQYFFVFNDTFIEEPFSYTCYCALFFLLCCDNPSKWGLQQPTSVDIVASSSCDNPSKWGLQQHSAVQPMDVGCCNNPSKLGLQQHLQSMKEAKISCNNPSKLGLQQHCPTRDIYDLGCNNPSKLGLQQHLSDALCLWWVVITPQNWVFNNT